MTERPAKKRRPVRRLLAWTGGLLILLIAGVLIAPSFIDWNQFRPRIAQTIEQALGREAKLTGDVAFRILPAPRLSVAGFALANDPRSDTPNMLSLDRLAVDVAVLPLLIGEIRVQRIVLDDPLIRIEQYDDGTTNLPLPDPAEEEDSGAAPPLAIDRLAIRGGTVVYVTPGTVQRLTQVDLDISVDSLDGPFRVDGSLIANGVPLELALRTGALSDPAMPIEAQVALADAGTLQLDGTVGLSALAADLTLQLEAADAARLAAQAGEAAGAPATVPAGLDKPLSLRAAIGSDGQTYRVSDLDGRLGEARLTGQVTANPEPGGRLAVDLVLAGLNLDPFLQASEPSAPPADGEEGPVPAPPPALPDLDLDLSVALRDLRYRGQTHGPVTLALTSGSLSDPKMPLDLRITLADAATVRLDGTVGLADLAADLALSVQADNAARLIRLAGDLSGSPLPEPVPDRLDGPLTVSAAIGSDGTTYRVSDIDARLGAARLSGRVAAATQPRPDLTADLTLAGLDLDPFLAAAERQPADSGPSSQAPAEKSAPAAPFAVPDVGLDVTVTVQDLGYRGQRLGPIRLAVAEADGALVLKEASARLPGAQASVTGRLTAQKGAPRFAGPLSLQVTDIGRLAALADMRAADLPPALKDGLAFQAQLTASDTRAALDRLSLRYAETEITGSAAAGLTDGRFSAKVAANLIDLDALTPPAPKDAPPADRPDQGQDGLWSKEPVDLSALQGLTGEIDARVGRVILSGVNVADAKLRIALADGVARIEDLSGDVFGGRLRMTGRVDASAAQPQMAVDLGLENATLAKLAGLMAQDSPIVGTGTLRTSLNTAGLSFYDWIRGLDGSLSLEAKDGALRGFDLPRLVDQLRSAQNPAGIAALLQTSLEGGETAFSTFRADARAEDGVFRFPDITGDLAGGALAAQAGINLADLSLDAGGTVALTQLDNAPPLPFTLKGSLSDPRFAIDQTALQQFLVQRLTSGALNRLLGLPEGSADSPEEAIGNILGGFLRGRERDKDKDKKQDER